MTAPLALDGGSPVRENPVPHHRPSFSGAEAEAAARALESGQVAGPGPFCRRVEKRLEERWDVPRVLTVTSCTHALETALLAMDLAPSEEVVVPSYTYVSCGLAVLRAGGRPVFADVDPETLTLTPKTVRPVLTERTRAVMLVHYGGYPAPTSPLRSLCEREGLSLLEDAAQAFGTARNDHPAGTVGRFGAFSFHGSKVLSCGEGGVLVVGREEDVSTCERIRDKGTDRSATRLGDVDRYTWRSTGSSYVLSDILAAVLEQQLERWPTIRRRRRTVQDRVREGIREVDRRDRFDLLIPPEDVRENGHMTGFLTGEPGARDWLLKALQAEGIRARAHYRPLHESPFARDHLDPPQHLPVTERVSRTIVRLPAHPEMSDEDTAAVLDALEKVYPHL